MGEGHRNAIHYSKRFPFPVNGTKAFGQMWIILFSPSVLREETTLLEKKNKNGLVRKLPGKVCERVEKPGQSRSTSRGA